MKEQAPTTTADAGLEQEAFNSALTVVRSAPGEFERWSTLEQLGGELGRVEDVAAAYREALGKELDSSVANTLGGRASAYHEEWMGDDSETQVTLLGRVLTLAPHAAWALERLSAKLTLGERWDDLLKVYDDILGATRDDARRERLLDEAANVAKNFAGQAMRAIDYQQRLLPLRPRDGELAASLERLLEREQQWEALIQFWKGRIEVLGEDATRPLRAQIATCRLDRLGDPNVALDELRDLLALRPSDEEARLLLERILSTEDTPEDARDRALDLLRTFYEGVTKPEEVIRVLKVRLGFADDRRKVELHREIAERLVVLQQMPEAIDNYVALMAIDPTLVDDHQRLRHLTEKSSLYEPYVQGLVAAADVCEGIRRVALLVEAGHAYRDVIEDRDKAIDVYARILGEEGLDPRLELAIAQGQAELLLRAGRMPERLAVLERIAVIEPDKAVKRAVLGEVGRLATRLEMTEHALAAWRGRLASDGEDREALDAVVVLLSKHERWESLSAALRQRASASVKPHQRRADLVWIAQIYASKLDRHENAVEVWNEIEKEFGETNETIESLAKNLTTVTRWSDLASVLERATGHETARVANLSARLGDVFRTRLGQSKRAVSCYQASLKADPVYPDAREGLAALLGSAEAGAEAVEVLSTLFYGREEWAELAAIVEFRLQVAEAGAARATVLRETATLKEKHANDLGAALDLLRRAMAETPADTTLDVEVDRLATATENWGVAVAAYRGAIEALGEADTKRTISLRMSEGMLLEQKLERAIEALAAYAEILAIDVGYMGAVKGAVRTGAKAGKWSSVSRASVLAMAEHGGYDEGLIEMIEGLAEERKGWDPLARSFEAVIREVVERDPELAANLEARLALWQRDKRSQLVKARDALLRSLSSKPAQLGRLEMLVVLQRDEVGDGDPAPEPGAALLDTLLKIAALRADHYDELYEAAALAVKLLGDSERTRGILTDLLERSAALWNRGVETAGERKNADCAGLSIESLASFHLAAGEKADAAELLARGGTMPFEAEKAQDMRLRAAGLFVQLGGRVRAIELYQSVLDERPKDLDVIKLLAPLCEEEGRWEQLLAVRRQQLRLTDEGDERLALRLDVARIVGVVEKRGGRVQVLLDNLEERPGHDDSHAALTDVLTEKGRFLQLTDFVSGHAEQLEHLGDKVRAAKLWYQAAELSEHQLREIRRSLSCHRRVVALEPNIASLDSLARLHVGEGEHADAVPWLERRLDRTPAGNEHTVIVLRLARAYVGAEKVDSAIRCLARANTDNPAESEIRGMLVGLYREHERWEPLADLLLAAADHVDDRAEAEASLRDAIEVNRDKLGALDRAVPALRKLVELRPDDSDARILLADALYGAKQLADARKVLEQAIVDYGRRRPPGRAQIHYKLACVLRDEKNRQGALAQLDEAARIDTKGAPILIMLAEVAREVGDLPRAERAYRALLLAARRNPKAVEAGEAQVLYELSTLAAERDQADQARELLESSVTLAIAEKSQAERLQTTLRARRDLELLMRVLKTRLEQVSSDSARATIVADLGDAHEQAGQREEGLQYRLEAIRLSPTQVSFHTAAREHASRMGAPERYVEVIRELLARAIKDGDDALVAELRLRLADVMERDIEDLDRANALYKEVESSGTRVVDAWIGLARVAAARGDRKRQVELLEQISELPDDQMSAEARAQTAFGLAELHLAEADSRDAGIAAIKRALAADARYDIAEPILRRAVSADPDHEGLGVLYEQVVRKLGDPRMLLTFLEGRAARSDVGFDVLREAVAVAESLEDDEHVEQNLDRTVELASVREGATNELVWAYSSQAVRRRASGEVAAAIALIHQARAASDWGHVFDLALEMAGVAVKSEETVEQGIELYEELLSHNSSDRNVWYPLLTIYRDRNAQEQLEKLMHATLETIDEIDERTALRLDVVRGMLAEEGREADAVKILRQALEEDGTNSEAQMLLAEVFERTGYDEELAKLLRQQFEAALTGDDEDMLVSLSLRLGKLLAKSHPEDALDIYRRALEPAPQRRELIEAVLSQLGHEADPRERAEMMERLLGIETGEAAVTLAVELSIIWSALLDEAAAVRVLNTGYRASPKNRDIRAKLEERYREGKSWGPLAELLEFAADQEDDKQEAVKLLRESARLHGDKLADPHKATKVLRAAHGLEPQNQELVLELAKALAEVAEHRAAITELSSAIEWDPPMDGDSLVEFLKLRAEYRGVIGDHTGVVIDLEQAYLRKNDLLDDLLDALERLRERAREKGERNTERAATLRLVGLLQETDDNERARDVLGFWVRCAPDDAEALRQLLDMDTAAGHWNAVIENCKRLIAAESGEDKVAAGLRLVEACITAGDITRAREGLEQVHEADPYNEDIRRNLKMIYEQEEAFGALARILIEESESIVDKDRRFKTLRHAGELLLDEDGEAAAEALSMALEIKPTDQHVNLMLVDAYSSVKRFKDAHRILDVAITSMRGRRSPELSRLQYRKATLARVEGDNEGELRWLKEAYHSDRNNGEVAVELADMAEQREDFDLAIRVLRSIALMDSAPISRAMAYLRQGFIADRRGDRQKAVLWGRKALMEDPNCQEATEFLGRIGEL